MRGSVNRFNRRIGTLGLFMVVSLVWILTPSVVWSQDSVQIPVERYSLSPYLYDSFLFLQGTTLPDAIKLDLSLGVKYLRRPWRLYLELYPDSVQFPVNDHIQFRPGVSFGFRQWLDVALVVPFAYQTAGEGDVEIVNVSDQDGMHLMDLELFVKVPLLHNRWKGIGVAFAGQLFFPTGSGDSFTGDNGWKSALLLAADWRWENLVVSLNTGVLLRGDTNAMDIPVGSEWLIRPGVGYLFPFGTYSVGVSTEINVATGIDSFFGPSNVDAFQLLFSVGLVPTSMSGGFYAALGGNSGSLESRGYGVPSSHFDSRLGYSLRWGEKVPVVVAQTDTKPVTKPTATKTSEKPEGENVAKATQLQPGETETGTEPTTIKTPEESESVTVAKTTQLQPRENGEEPLATSSQVESGESPDAKNRVVSVVFAVDMPKPVSEEDPRAYSDSPDQPAVPKGLQESLRQRKPELLEKIRLPEARLMVVAFADKCYEGAPFLSNQYNVDLTHRRANAVADFIKGLLGEDLTGVAVQLVPLGRRCANPKCDCKTPDMPECNEDRRVDVFVEYGPEHEFQCPTGDYWLSR